MKDFKAWFHGGIAVSATIVIGAALGLFYEPMRSLFRPNILLLYDAVAVAHMLLLFVLAGNAARVSRGDNYSQWLYTAGFLHTLLALSLAVANAGYLLIGSSAVDLAALGNVVAPMGAAIIPHFIGVWAGATLEKAYGAGEEDLSFLEKLAADATIAQDELRVLYAERKRLIEQEIDGLQQVNQLYSSVHGNLSASASRLAAAVVGISNSTQVAGSTVAQASTDLQRGFAEVAAELENTRAIVSRMASELASATKDAGSLSGSFRSATQVVTDIERLHRSIVELLSNELFKQTA